MSLSRSDLVSIETVLRRIVREEIAPMRRLAEMRVADGHIPPAVNTGGYVYFAHSPSTKAVKIGMSRDVYKRLATIRSNIPARVELAGAYWVADPKTEEAGLHRRFMHLHILNEWFVDGDDIIEFAAWATSREYLGPPIESVVRQW